MNKTKIDWATMSWNPLTGCRHGCPYCYARRTAHRFDKGLKDPAPLPGGLHVLEKKIKATPYPYGFEPTLHRYRLNQPERVEEPQTVFVCSMSDLFGKWVPTSWIAQVIDACLRAPQHRYLFLTKNPARYLELDHLALLPHGENFWYGSTVANRDAAAMYPMPWANINTFWSMEPLLEPVAMEEAEGLPQVRSELPATYSSYRLLTALDFNAHTNSRYAEPGGTEVVMDGRRTLRIGPEGTVTYDSGEEDAGGRGGALEALRAAGRLAAALTGGVDASPLYLRRLEEREDGYLVGFQYQVEGVPVRFPDEADALTVLVRGAGIAEFTCRCRTYVPEEEASVLLPPIMAAAIASLYPEGELSLGYVDSGSGRLHADWLV